MKETRKTKTTYRCDDRRHQQKYQYQYQYQYQHHHYHQHQQLQQQKRVLFEKDQLIKYVTIKDNN
eukprot:CAMPEP_0170874360 /NCGR_PEP_ID=MMETSP0734-20130129/28084_1 /TAXON_ID=186038 /ORGANISM="Fragilariopsis kerguelensis, Strain L26-C5" /LENGTH=64 /DNA_ID=CAMNT_0011255259 /DNA_START=40 /DNA_END=234 /DNA_ORIENTATION=-